MKKLIVLLLFMIPIGISGQVKNYYTKDSIVVIGIKLIDAGSKANAQYVSIERGITLLPDDISEYGFKNTQVYVSKEISIDDTIKRVFLEKLTAGKIRLYYYEGDTKLFFVEKDGFPLVEISKNTENNKTAYKAQLMEIAEDCPAVAEVTDFVGYNKRSFTRFFNHYNKCASRPFPHIRYGIKAGYEWSKISVIKEKMPHIMKSFNFDYRGALSVGLFADMPIMASDLSVNMSINYSQHKYSFDTFADDEYFDFDVNMSSLKTPVFVRYSFPTNQFRYFIQSGGLIEYNFNKSVLLYRSGERITVEGQKTPVVINDNRFGFSLCTGLECKLTKRHSLFFELSFNQLYGDMRNKDLLLTVGINL